MQLNLVGIISRIIQTFVNVICQAKGLEVDNIDWGLDNSWYYA